MISGYRRTFLLFTVLLSLLLWRGDGTPAAAGDDTYRSMELFTDVLAIIQKSYVEEVDTDELVYGAIRGMLQTLDPHSSFLTPELYQEMKVDTHGEFGGLGIEISLRDGRLVVVAPIEGTPAADAGILAGDVIISIDGEPIKNIDLTEAVKKLRGPKGSTVTLEVLRDDEKEPRSFSLRRDIIQIRSVKARMLENGYAYVKVTQFQEKTAADLGHEIAVLQQEEILKGLILDLRNNPGGLLDQAVAAADLFLESGLILYTEGREPGSQMRFEATAEGTEPPYPMVVLINGGSASASEIVAGALSDHGRAILLGERSFGKGSVQTILPLSDKSGLRLTTARYFTPSGVSIQAKGIEPDIFVSAKKLQDEESFTHFREQDLEHHIETPADSQREERNVIELTPEDRSDLQLMRALDLLKGLEIMKGKLLDAA